MYCCLACTAAYNVAAQELSEQQLASALRAALAGSSGVPSPAAAAAAADVGGGGELDPPGSREQAASLGGEQLLLLQTAAAAAAAAHAVQQGSCHAARLHLIGEGLFGTVCLGLLVGELASGKGPAHAVWACAGHLCCSCCHLLPVEGSKARRS